jgi:hypothetical protein
MANGDYYTARWQAGWWKSREGGGVADDYPYAEYVDLAECTGGEAEALRSLWTRAEVRRRYEQCRSGRALRRVERWTAEPGRLVLETRLEEEGGPAPPETGAEGYLDDGGRFVRFADVPRAG